MCTLCAFQVRMNGFLFPVTLFSLNAIARLFVYLYEDVCVSML